MGKKIAPVLVLVGGRKSTSRAILSVLLHFDSNIPRQKGKADVQKYIKNKKHQLSNKIKKS